eukprot:gene20151-23951_t
MDKINLLLIITIITLFISLFLAFFLLTVQTKHKISNVLFAVFLFVTAIDTSHPLFDLGADGPSNLGMLRTTLSFLQLPIFYLYVLSVCYADFKLKPKYLLHLLPFLIGNAILLPRFYTVDAASKINFIMNRQNMIELQFSHTLIHIQIIGYFAAVFMLLRKVKKLYLENYAGASIKSYNWLFQFTSVLTVLYLIVILKNTFKFSDYPYISEWIKIAILVCIDSKLKLTSDLVLEEQNSTQSGVNEKEYNEELLKLKQYMMEKQPFLNPSLTIQDVARDIKVPVRNLSLLINHKLEQHFYDFVNAYRIEFAMDILKDATKSKVTVLEILYEVGFNSKSSFNTAFKKHTGNTPTSYRKNL